MERGKQNIAKGDTAYNIKLPGLDYRQNIADLTEVNNIRASNVERRDTHNQKLDPIKVPWSCFTGVAKQLRQSYKAADQNRVNGQEPKINQFIIGGME